MWKISVSNSLTEGPKILVQTSEVMQFGIRMGDMPVKHPGNKTIQNCNLPLICK